LSRALTCSVRVCSFIKILLLESQIFHK
jgi:hypothetical protein